MYEDGPIAELIAAAKQYLASRGGRIALDDLCREETGKAAERLSALGYSHDEPSFSAEIITQRLHGYESSIDRLLPLVTLIARWGDQDHLPTLAHVIRTVVAQCYNGGGYQAWLALRWHPAVTVLFASGLAATASDNWRALSTILRTEVRPPLGREGKTAAVFVIIDQSGGAEDLYKKLADYSRSRFPRNDYLCDRLRPELNAVLGWDYQYEENWERFEVLLALAYADVRYEDPVAASWAPPGRFLFNLESQGGAYDRLVEAAKRAGDAWEPVRVGLFSGPTERFVDLAAACRESLRRISPYW